MLDRDGRQEAADAEQLDSSALDIGDHPQQGRFDAVARLSGALCFVECADQALKDADIDPTNEEIIALECLRVGLHDAAARFMAAAGVDLPTILDTIEEIAQSNMLPDGVTGHELLTGRVHVSQRGREELVRMLVAVAEAAKDEVA